MQLTTYLFLGKGEEPPEYTDLVLCRDIYHCTPDELDALDYERVLMHTVVLSVESKVRARRSRQRTSSGGMQTQHYSFGGKH